jgi:hypothetical protein
MEREMAKRGGSDIRRWALIGAEQRLLQLAEEAAAIHRAFPELRQGARGRDRQRLGTGDADRPGSRRKRRMSAAGRKRISEAQKARWAKQRKQQK